MRLSSSNERWEAGRLLTLTDGVFAIVMTLMVLDIRIQEGLDHQQFLHSLREIWRNVLYYLLSFLILSKIWIGHHCRFNAIAQVDRVFVGLSLASLALIALVPALTNLVGDYPHEPLAGMSYCGLFFLIGVIDFWGWEYALDRGHLMADKLCEDDVRTWTFVRLALPTIALICFALAIFIPAEALYVFLGLTIVAPFLRRWFNPPRPASPSS
ncbi:MAG TPA: TMEM175 family protein [Fimbriimonadaceae bacterium]|nr:TMEM175 family protein [Fimbriimonadaceae bacterium]HRJ96208.1 TMEM175 family protein [Fimbriimonadaceae bacterium]